MSLIIVESPTKSKTLQGFLGTKYKVLSSYGHVRDLPKSELGVDVEKDFEPRYIVPLRARKNVNLLKKEAKKTDLVILATDEDREGEAIAWHLSQALDLNDNYERIVFHEITKEAIEEALANPRKIDLNLVNSQQARRILDRIVGYKLSPFLWKKVARGLSAGRVQSIAVRLVVERQREIDKFAAQEYWTVSALLKKMKEAEPLSFEALLTKKNDKVLDKLEIKNEKEAKEIVKDLEKAEYRVESVEKKETRKNPFPPFTTSTLQQTAFRKFHWPAKMTMSIAQNLYERGFITYHRTDSLNLSNLALNAAKNFITKTYGESYWQFRQFKTKAKGAQEAHEAVRPTYADKAPDILKGAELDERGFKLYDLIWRRFTACQMSQAVFNAAAADITAKNCVFRATGQTLKFDGFLKVYPVKYEEVNLPDLIKEEILELLKLNPLQHFTQPPAQYTEATLIKALEAEGIGRPSTYAPILSTVQERNYIQKDKRRYFRPTEIGTVVNDILTEHFPEVVDIKFTAQMEEELDEVAQGSKEWIMVIREFYQPFASNLERKYGEVSKKEFTETPTGKKCPKCGSPILIRLGKFGRFYACSNFPKCRFTASLEQHEGDTAENNSK